MTFMILRICILLIFSYLVSSQVTWFDESVCKNGSPIICSSSDVIQVVSTTLVEISNCEFIDCPSIVINNQNSVVTLSNVTFTNSMGSSYQGREMGAIYVASASSLKLSQVKFTNCNSKGNGGALIIENVPEYQIESSLFKDCTASANGGAISFEGWTFQHSYNYNKIYNTTFDGCSAGFDGGAISFNQVVSHFSWEQGICVNNKAGGNGGCISINSDLSAVNLVYKTELSVTLMALEMKNGSAGGSGGLIDIRNPHLSLTVIDSSFTNSTASKSGGCVNAENRADISLARTSLTSCKTDGRGGGISMEEGVQAFIENSIISLSEAKVKGGGIAVQGGCKLFFRQISTLYKCTAGQGGCLSVGQSSEVRFETNSLISNCSATESGGGVYVYPQSSFACADCNLVGNTAGVSGGAIKIESGTVSLSKMTLIRNNSAFLNGGAIDASGNSDLSLLNTITIRFNTVSHGKGGAIHVQDLTSLSFKTTNFLNEHNKAPLGNFVAISGETIGLFVAESKVIQHKQEEVYLGSCQMANYYQTQLLKTYKQLKFFSKPCGLKIVSPSSFPTQPFLVNQALPAIHLELVDAAGQLATRYNPAIDPIVVSMIPQNPSAVMTGDDNVKLLQNPKVSFSDVIVANVDSALYSFSFQFSRIYESDEEYISSESIPNISVEYFYCDEESGKKMINETTCWNLVKVNDGNRKFFASISIIGCIFSITMLALVIKFRSWSSIENAGKSFTMLVALGTFLAYVGTSGSLHGQMFSCVWLDWFENLGFSFVFVALSMQVLLKQKLFHVNTMEGVESETPNSSNRKGNRMLSERTLIKWQIVCIVLTVAYLITWSIIEPSLIQHEPIHSMSIFSQDRCLRTYFGNVMSMTKFLLEMIATFFAMKLLKDPDCRKPALLLITWFLFGGSLDIISRFLVVNVDAAYSLKFLSILIPITASQIASVVFPIMACLPSLWNGAGFPSSGVGIIGGLGGTGEGYVRNSI